MKFKKIVLDEIKRCYCVSHIYAGGELKVVFASEGIDEPCRAYSGASFENREELWKEPGGTMSFVAIPGSDGGFLAIQRAYPRYNMTGVKIVRGRFIKSGCEIRDFIELPYAHRFDVLESEGRLHFIGATLCNTKREREDWSDPGKLWAGELPADFGAPMGLRPIKESLVKNHGYWRGTRDGANTGYIACDSGIYAASPPREGRDWQVELILAGRFSDVACYDLDGDGADEIAAISPFHGDELTIRKKTGDSRYDVAYRYPNPIDTAHALWAGPLNGIPTIIFGIRKMDGELGYIRYDKNTGGYRSEIIEKGVGTANVSVIRRAGGDIIAAANHAKNEAAVYFTVE